MSTLFQHLAESFRRPDHWVYASWLDIVTSYRRTYFGIFWLLIPTAVYIWGIGGFIGSLQPGINLPRFCAHVAVGFVVYRLVSTVLLDASSVFNAHRSYIYDGNLRLTDFLLRSLARSGYYYLLTQPLLIAALLASPDFHWAGVPLSMLGLVIVFVNLFAYSTIFGLLGARFPDLHEFMGSVMMAGFLVTPVVWYPALAPADTVQGMLMRANPFHHLLAAVRAPLLSETIEPVTWVYLAVMTVAGVVVATLAYRGFSRQVAKWL